MAEGFATKVNLEIILYGDICSPFDKRWWEVVGLWGVGASGGEGDHLG